MRSRLSRGCRWRAASLGVGQACLVSCQPAPQAPDPAPVVWAGEHIELASNGDPLICAGTPEYLDSFVGGVLSEMQIVGAGPARYYILTREELDALDVCPVGDHCALGPWAYTTSAIDKHEALHAARAVAFGTSPTSGSLPGVTFFEEGLAVMYANSGFMGASKEVVMGIEAVPSLRGHFPEELYGLAGDFARFVSVEHGVSRLFDFVGAQGDAESISDLELLYQAHFGQGLSAAVSEYQEDYPLCSSFARTRHVVECAQPPTPFIDGRIDVSFDLRCGSEGVVGPRGGMMWQSFTFDVTEETPPGLMLAAPRADVFGGDPPCVDVVMQVADCDRGCLTSVDLQEPQEDPTTRIETVALFQPGRYLVRLARPVDSPGRACIGIETPNGPGWP